MRRGWQSLLGLGSFALVCGCQELLGIEPWGGDGGAGAAGTTSDGVTTGQTTGTANGPASSSASTGTGAPCAIHCMGGACDEGVCQPLRIPLESVTEGHLATLGTDVIVARKLTNDPGYRLSRFDKYAQHVEVPYAINDSVVRSLATSSNRIYWAGANTLHRIDGVTDTLLTTPEHQAVTVAATLGEVTFNGAEHLCFTNPGPQTGNGGLWCQEPKGGAAPTRLVQLDNPAGVAGVQNLAYTVASAGTGGAAIYSATLTTPTFIRNAPGAFSPLGFGDGLYWLSNGDLKVHRVDLADPIGSTELGGRVTSGGKRVLGRGSYVYVLYTSGIERFDRTTMARDASFGVTFGGVVLDFAVDAEGVYWLTGGDALSELGFLALPHDADP